MNPNNTDSLPPNKIEKLTKNLEIEHSVKKNSDDSVPKNIIGITNNFDNIVVESPINIIDSRLKNVNNEIQNIPTFFCNNNVTFIDIFEGVTAGPIDDAMSVVLFLKDNTKLENLFDELSLQIDNKNMEYIKNVFDFLSVAQNHNKNYPIYDIVSKTKDILENGKVNLHDIPLLVNIIADKIEQSLSFFKTKIKLNAFLIGLIIKLLIYTLVILRIISTSEIKLINFNKTIDSSIALLFKKFRISTTRSFFNCCG